MSERKTWADVLDVLPLKKRPYGGLLTVLDYLKGAYAVSGLDWYHRVSDDDAHAHIRIAAEDYVRDAGYFVIKSGNTYAVVKDQGHAALWYEDLPTALYHAVAYCKEHQQ